jgi:hypothetical protein
MRRCAVLLLSTLLLTGCSGSATIDHARLEREIHHWAVKREQVSPRAHVTCPADVPIKAGSTFHCLISAGGQTVRLTVTIENSDGYVTWVVG